MNIENMTDKQKSVMLARLCGWDGPNFMTGPQLYVINDEKEVIWFGVDFDLYDPANMALLARVIEWAWENDVSYEKIDPENIHGSMCEAVDNILRAGMVGETS